MLLCIQGKLTFVLVVVSRLALRIIYDELTARGVLLVQEESLTLLGESHLVLGASAACVG